MSKFKFPFLQAAGVSSHEEADILIDVGFNYIGFPFFLDVHEEDISIDIARELIKVFPKNVDPVLITYLNKADEIIDAIESLGVNIVQLHGRIESDELKKLCEMNLNISIIKSLVIRTDNLTELKKIIKDTEELVEAFITDTFDPETGASGATGKTHDWAISKDIVESTKKPVILAGGLTPENVSHAIEVVKPYGVDVHTGIEKSDGSKDQSLSYEFVKSAKESFSRIL